MNTLSVRGVRIGEGLPKICVSLTEKSKDAILKQAEVILQSPVDIVEWRVDCFDSACYDSACYDSACCNSVCFEEIIAILNPLRERLKDVPLIFTFRSLEEGGQKSLDSLKYTQLLKKVMKSKTVDIIDVEVFKSGLGDDTLLGELLSFAKNHKVLVLASYHDFTTTPPEEELIARLEHMRSLDVGLLKIAVMPENEQDVQTLLSVGEKYNARARHLPLVAISMGELGKRSRLINQNFTPSFTFGSLGKGSAPGQIHVDELHKLLRQPHHTFLR